MDQQFLNELVRRYQAATFVVTRTIASASRDRLPEGLTPDQTQALLYIRDAGRSTPTEMADAFCVGKSSITAIVSRLVEKGLVERRPDDTDRRVIYLSLTDEGVRLADEAERQIAGLLAGYVKHFDEAEAAAFIRTLEKLAAVLQEQEEK